MSFIPSKELFPRMNRDIFDRIKELEQENKRLKERLKAGAKWTSVEDVPLADIAIERNGTHTTTTYENIIVDVDMLFAVPLSKGNYSICRGYINEGGCIEEILQNGEHEYWGYSLADVSHYMQIFSPKDS